MKKLTQRIVFVLVIVAVCIGGWTWYQAYAAKAHATVYITKEVTHGDVAEKVLTTGTLQPLRTIAIGSQVSGQVKKLYADFNTLVKKGQLLAEIDPAPLLDQRAQAQGNLDNVLASQANNEANLASAESNVRNAVVSISTAREGVESARVAVANAQANLAVAQAGVAKAKTQLAADLLNYQRNDALRKKDLNAQADLDAARTTWLESKSAVESAQQQANAAAQAVRSAEVGLISARTLVDAAMEKKIAADDAVEAARQNINGSIAQVKGLKAALHEVDVNIAYTKIRAPVDGIIISRAVDEGQTIASSLSAPTLFSMGTDLKTMQVDANVDESDMSRVFVNQKAEFTVDAYPDETFEGVVFQVRNSPVTVNNVVTYDVMIHLDNSRLRLKPGMTANLQLLVSQKKAVVLAPNMALRFRPEGSTDAPSPSPSASASPSPSASASPSAEHHHRPGGGAGGPGGPGHIKRKTRGRVYVLENGVPVAHDVRIGITDGTNTEIRDGLTDGMLVVTGTEGPKGSTAGAKPPGGGRMF